MLVATDALNGNKWHYLDGWYHQYDTSGVFVSKLSAKNFPDPFNVWENKVRKSEGVIQRPLTEPERQMLKPRQYIFDIWEHKNAEYND